MSFLTKLFKSKEELEKLAKNENNKKILLANYKNKLNELKKKKKITQKNYNLKLTSFKKLINMEIKRKNGLTDRNKKTNYNNYIKLSKITKIPQEENNLPIEITKIDGQLERAQKYANNRKTKKEEIKFRINNLNRNKPDRIPINSNMYADPGNNLQERENINSLIQYNNTGIELKNMKDTKFSKREKTKNLFNMLFNNSNTNKLYFGNNKYRRDMFKEELVNSIEKLSKNHEIYKIIKSYNSSKKELTEKEKVMIKEYILSIFKKHYPKIYNRITAENP
jgi:hypothetical protein